MTTFCFGVYIVRLSMPKKLTTCLCVSDCRANLNETSGSTYKFDFLIWIFYSSVICGAGPRARPDSAAALHHGLGVGVLHVAPHISWRKWRHNNTWLPPGVEVAEGAFQKEMISYILRDLKGFECFLQCLVYELSHWPTLYVSRFIVRPDTVPLKWFFWFEVLQTVVHQYGAIALSLLPFHFQARLSFSAFLYLDQSSNNFYMFHIERRFPNGIWARVAWYFFFTFEKIMFSKVLFFQRGVVPQECHPELQNRYRI